MITKFDYFSGKIKSHKDHGEAICNRGLLKLYIIRL